ncbi:MAG: ribosome maturation factor RimP [SAR324 cluster bacterium]|nr:ribosome maturation factor RimP [SAR324 cluster bacterium]MBL7035340.1 ribosome maturation factor RimP [SAR324 cluster bacterium]
MAQNEEYLFNLLAEPIKAADYELIDLVFSKHGTQTTIQLFIDSANGVDIDDCVTVNQVAQEILDSHDPISTAYTLEVSTPGIFRKLKTPEHFKAFTGERIKIRLLQKIKGLKDAVGNLQECSENGICIKLEKDGTELEIPYSLITRANLEPELNY